MLKSSNSNIYEKFYSSMILHKILTLPLLQPFPATAQRPTVCSRRCSPENKIGNFMKNEKNPNHLKTRNYISQERKIGDILE